MSKSLTNRQPPKSQMVNMVRFQSPQGTSPSLRKEKNKELIDRLPNPSQWVMERQSIDIVNACYSADTV